VQLLVALWSTNQRAERCASQHHWVDSFSGLHADILCVHRQQTCLCQAVRILFDRTGGGHYFHQSAGRSARSNDTRHRYEHVSQAI